MSAWVLILIIYGAPNAPVAVTTVPFNTEVLCEAAAEDQEKVWNKRDDGTDAEYPPWVSARCYVR